MIGCVRCAYILGLLISGTAAQWDGDMNNAREDEYFGNRLREHAPQEDWGPVAPQRYTCLVKCACLPSCHDLHSHMYSYITAISTVLRTGMSFQWLAGCWQASC